MPQPFLRTPDRLNEGIASVHDGQRLAAHERAPRKMSTQNAKAHTRDVTPLEGLLQGAAQPPDSLSADGNNSAPVAELEAREDGIGGGLSYLVDDKP